MDFYNNNYFQSKEFKELNKEIFDYEIIDTIENKFYIYRNNSIFNKKINISKANFGSEFRGILETFGQIINLNSKNYSEKLKSFLKKNNEIVENRKIGIITFRAFDIEQKEKFDEIKDIFKNEKFVCRPWKTSIINLNSVNKDDLIKSFYTRREIRRIKKKNVFIENVNSFEEYKLYIKYFLKSFGHENYPNKNKYYCYSMWENLKIFHNFFIIKVDKEPYAIFGVRIFNNRAYWCMVGRLKNYKYSLHAYAIDFLFDFLNQKKVDFLDLTGFNPNPKTKKEESIKKFKNLFNAKIIYQPTFIKDNTFLIKTLRKISNKILSKNTFADQNIF